MTRCFFTSMLVLCLLVFGPQCGAPAADIGPLAEQAGFASVDKSQADNVWASYRPAQCEPQACDAACEGEACEADACEADACCEAACCSDSGCEGCGGRDRCRCGVGCRVCRFLRALYRCLNSTCDMPPHYPYFPPMHGYYYFRPYHHSHLTQQQAFVTTWGGDPRNPYANQIFQKVYAEYQADQGVAPKAPKPAILQ